MAFVEWCGRCSDCSRRIYATLQHALRVLPRERTRPAAAAGSEAESTVAHNQSMLPPLPVGTDSVWKFRSSGKIRVCEIIFCAVRPSPSLRPLPLLRGRCSAPESVRLSPRTASTDNSGIRSPTPARPHVRRRTVRPVSTGTPCPMSADLWDNSRPFHCPGAARNTPASTLADCR